MGNCQAAEVAAAAVVQHPNGRTERFFSSPKASHVMASNPGHYVAVIVTAIPKTTKNSGNKSRTGKGPVRYLKLLCPDDTLLVGHVYRLVSFEEVLREFGSKKRVRLSRLIARDRGGRGVDGGRPEDSSEMVEEQKQRDTGRSMTNGIGNGVLTLKHQQWRPTLQSIAEAEK